MVMRPVARGVTALSDAEGVAPTGGKICSGERGGTPDDCDVLSSDSGDGCEKEMRVCIISIRSAFQEEARHAAPDNRRGDHMRRLRRRRARLRRVRLQRRSRL
ncbi:hypothetical protein MPC4_80151 [Methylocella tundrae]|uniref:Uncharacterized protein n=1 Tax=Methylocella tundrae TaxID=227605 RepID=A0A8B6MBU7_METTU|nr:hypothetical protein MPC1_70020 [Methylocella tundrae]VTZ52480.1 hypothetical protein MPC4_80151 [Methylocella tundrae]